MTMGTHCGQHILTVSRGCDLLLWMGIVENNVTCNRSEWIDENVWIGLRLWEVFGRGRDDRVCGGECNSPVRMVVSRVLQ